MNPCFREKFLKNGEIFSKNDFSKPGNGLLCVYEVLRVIDGVPLFIEDHLARLKNSLDLLNIIYNIDVVEESIKKLLEINNYIEGNVRVELFIENGKSDLFGYYIEHHYPNDVDYRNGVRMKSLVAERSNPNAKMIHENLKLNVAEILENQSIYEVLLVTSHGFVTEGSRSNVFFVKEQSVYTAPENMVLAGITRKYVFEAIRSCGLKLNESPISYNTLTEFSSCFLTGTSPKVLPINKIDAIDFDVSNSIISKILEAYNKLIEVYITSHKI